MWTSRKRALLWHTARNILAIFYTLQIVTVSCCRTPFDDVQSKALSSSAVIAGTIRDLDYFKQTASVHVTSVIKDTTDKSIQRKDVITISGLIPFEYKSKTLDLRAQPRGSLTSILALQQCFSFVNISSEYILFINHTQNSGADIIYKNVHEAVDYTKSDKKLIKSILCEDCGKCNPFYIIIVPSSIF